MLCAIKRIEFSWGLVRGSTMGKFRMVRAYCPICQQETLHSAYGGFTYLHLVCWGCGCGIFLLRLREYDEEEEED